MAQPAVAPVKSDPYVYRLPRQGFEELAVTVVGMPGMSEDQARELMEGLAGDDVRILRMDVFAPVSPHDPWPWPVTWVDSDTGPGRHLCGVYIQAVVGADVQPVVLDDQVVGSVLEGAHGREFHAAGMGPTSAEMTRPDQARETFERLEAALALAGMDFSHVLRTWLFLDDILAWYGEFNAVRTAFFGERRVFDGLVPASTGIGGRNGRGMAMVAGCYAFLPNDGQTRARALPSPLQCPALQYGSSFSRAVELDLPDHRRVLVSGTASIAPDGKTVHLDDCPGQVARTAEVVRAILESRGMDWKDVTRATAYVRDPADADLFQQYTARNELPSLPLVVANNTICRDDLLFELEVDAALAR